MVKIHIVIFWSMISCRFIDGHQQFGETQCFCLHNSSQDDAPRSCRMQVHGVNPEKPYGGVWCIL